MNVAGLWERYRSGDTPVDVVEEVLEGVSGADPNNVWIARRSGGKLRARAEELASESPDFEEKPLYGVPFAVKDNIDVGGMETTAGCPAFASEADADATVVRRLRAAGAVLVGKTNMDQFATGLVGTRSPYGEIKNPFDPAYISGGSSSGSGVAVASGAVSFALGTDTAGSGRVPAAMTNVVGLKPTRGALPNDGVVPACRTLDCVAVFATNAADALLVEAVAGGPSESDPYAEREPPATAEDAAPDSFTFGVPDDLTFFGDVAAESLYEAALSTLESIGGTRIEIDVEPFLDAGGLLYEGPWVAERLAAIGDFMESNPDALLPVTREIVTSGAEYSAVETFEAMYELKRLSRLAAREMDRVDLVCTPTAGTIYTREQVNERPVELNATLGRYTDYVNLLDLSAVAAPAGIRGSGPHEGLPFGVTLLGGAREEARLAAIADRFAREGGQTPGVPGTFEAWPAGPRAR